MVPTHEIFTNSLHCTGSLVFLAHIGGHFTDRSTWRQEAQQSPVFQSAVCCVNTFYFNVMQVLSGFYSLYLKNGPGNFSSMYCRHIMFLLVIFKGSEGNYFLRSADTHHTSSHAEVLPVKLKTLHTECFFLTIVFSARIITIYFTLNMPHNQKSIALVLVWRMRKP